MAAVGANNVEEFIVAAYGLAEETLSALGLAEVSRTRKNCLETMRKGGNLRRAAGAELFDRWVVEAKLRNTEHYAKQVLADRDYAEEHHARPPEKVKSELELFDCLTCDECIAVCPNRAAFAVSVPEPEIPSETVVHSGWGFEWARERGQPFKANHQIAVFADLCNACGNCDIFCPEQGGPHLRKPFLFNSVADYQDDRGRDGFHLGLQTIHARIEGKEYLVELDDGWVDYSGDGFRFRFNESKPQDTLTGEASGKVDMTPYHIMRILQMGVLQPSAVNFLTSRIAERADTDTITPEGRE
jgi:putative selenate reductase